MVHDIPRYRKAKTAGHLLKEMLHDPPWLLSAAVKITDVTGIFIEVVVIDAANNSAFLPNRIDGVPIIIRDAGPQQGEADHA